jgi:hypothetical protein
MGEVPSSADFEIAADVGQPGRLLATPGFAQKLINVMQPGPGQHALVADVLEAPQQIAQQLRFQIVAGREIHVAAFGWKRMIAAPSVRVQSRFA